MEVLLASVIVRNYTFQCPPPGAVEACPGSYRSRVGIEVDELFFSFIDNLMLVRSSDRAAAQHHENYVSLLSLFESLRIADCLIAFGPPCVNKTDHMHSLASVCNIARHRVNELARAHVGDANTGWEHHGCWSGKWERSRQLAQTFADKTYRWLLDNWASKHKMSKWMSERTPVSKAMPTLNLPPLLYPAEFAPPHACDIDASGQSLSGLIPKDGPTSPWRDVTGQFSDQLSVNGILSRLAKFGIPLSRFIINLGAADGQCGWGPLYDPANCLFSDKAWNMSGIIFEGDASNFITLGRLWGRKFNVHLRLGWTTPRLFVRDVSAVMPRDGSIDLLKVDVDNCDTCFVQALVEAGIEPKILHVEVTAIFPPQLAVRRAFLQEPTAGKLSRQRKHGICGSIGEFLRVAPRYRLLYVEFVNAVFIHESLYDHVAGSAGITDDEKWRLGYICHPLRSVHRHSPARQVRIAKGWDGDIILADPTVSIEDKKLMVDHLYRYAKLTVAVRANTH